MAVRFNRPMGARILKKILRYGGGGGVRFRCFTTADETSLVSGSSKNEEVLGWWIRKLPCRQRMSSRSEEHTSELQSQSNLVCRLLLEKKKKTQHYAIASDLDS